MIPTTPITRRTLLTAAVPPTPRTNLTRVGSWTLGKTLGRGAYAHVRLATHDFTGRQAACKILPSLFTAQHDPISVTNPISTTDRLDALEAHKELVILKALNGAKIPGVVNLEGVIERDGWNYVFLSLHPGTLSEYTKLSEVQAVMLFIDLLRTLEALHGLGVSHEDIKQSNILINEEVTTRGPLQPRPVLADFGFSHVTAPSTSVPEPLVHSNGGTHEYSSPQKLIDLPYNPFANDVWSLGIVFMKAMGFKHPYLGGKMFLTEKEATDHIVLGPPEWPWTRAQCTESGIGTFIMVMLETDPELRWNPTALLAHPYLTRRVKDIPDRIPLPAMRLSTKVSRPVPPAVLQDLMFLSYQRGELQLCETSRNLEERLYSRRPCWEQQYANMLAKWQQRVDLEWEDCLPPNITKRQTTKLARLRKTLPPMKRIHLSPLNPKSPPTQIPAPRAVRNKVPREMEVLEKGRVHPTIGNPGPAVPPPKTPPHRAVGPPRPLLTPIVAKRPKGYGFGRTRSATPLTQLSKNIPSSILGTVAPTKEFDRASSSLAPTLDNTNTRSLPKTRARMAVDGDHRNAHLRSGPSHQNI